MNLKFSFSMLGIVASLLKALLAPPMTRCECADMAFEAILEKLREGASLEELQHRTGCAATCTACLPDLQAFLTKQR